MDQNINKLTLTDNLKIIIINIYDLTDILLKDYKNGYSTGHVIILETYFNNMVIPFLSNIFSIIDIKNNCPKYINSKTNTTKSIFNTFSYIGCEDFKTIYDLIDTISIRWNNANDIETIDEIDNLINVLITQIKLIINKNKDDLMKNKDDVKNKDDDLLYDNLLAEIKNILSEDYLNKYNEKAPRQTSKEELRKRFNNLIFIDEYISTEISKEISDAKAQPRQYRVGGNAKVKKINKKEILGKERCIYKKPGDRKEYLKHKGELITVKDYKKLMKDKK